MAIHSSGTFDYVAMVSAEDIALPEPVLQARDRLGRPGPWLVGPGPRIVIGADRIVIAANGQDHANVWQAVFPTGDALLSCLRTDDILYLARTHCGGIGISLLRADALVLAVGAVTSLPLGRDVRVTRGPLPESESLSARTPPGEVWLEFSITGEMQTLRDRQAAQVASYDVYVERCWAVGMPGEDECVAISIRDDPGLRDRATRSAILLGNGELRLRGWEILER